MKNLTQKEDELEEENKFLKTVVFELLKNAKGKVLTNNEELLGMDKGFTEFLGIEITKKDGNKEFIAPHSEVKKEVEEVWNRRIPFPELLEELKYYPEHNKLEELRSLKWKIANFRKECTKDIFMLAPCQIELLNTIEKYFKNE